MNQTQTKTPRKGRVSDEKAAQMLADYQRLGSLPKAAALHGRSFQSLYSLLKYRGLITKTKERALPADKVQATEKSFSERGLT